MYMSSVDLSEIQGFDWDQGNIHKNEKKHGVTWKECEEVFVGKVYASEDIKHSKKEIRYYVLGTTFQGRDMFISFTIRSNKIRIISARSQNKKERIKFTNFSQAI